MTADLHKEIEEYRVITITHKTTSIQRLKDYFIDESDRESGDDYPAKRLTELKESFGMKELLYLNTCNRVTFFFTANDHIDHDYLTKLFHFINPALKDDLIERHLDVTTVFSGIDALRHLFSVSASLDSMIVGEREILGQIREAYEKSKAAGLSSDKIRLAIERAIVFAKKIYHETRIGEKPVSVVSLAFRQMVEHIPNKDSGILMIGAGQTNQQLANFIRKYEFTNVHVFNRTLSKAEELAAKIDGKAYSLDELADFKDDFQVVISCTGANGTVLPLQTFEKISKGKEHQYTMLDLAVPRDIDPAIVEKHSVKYLDVASLEEQANINMAFRQKEVETAKTILENFLTEYEETFRIRQLELAFSQIPEEVKALRSRAMNEVFSKEIDSLDTDAQKVLTDIVKYFEKKYIGIPMKIAKKTILGLDNFKD